MIQKLTAPVTVDLRYDHHRRLVRPIRLLFDGHDYLVRKIGFHHTYRNGRTLYHVFSVSTDTIFFRLVLNTDNLFWTVEEIHDNETA